MGIAYRAHAAGGYRRAGGKRVPGHSHDGHGEGLIEFVKQNIMRNIPEGAPADSLPPMPSIDLGVSTLARMVDAGAKVIAGTDANLDDPTTPADAVYGKAFQDELCYYVQAGMSPVTPAFAAERILDKYAPPAIIELETSTRLSRMEAR